MLYLYSILDKVANSWLTVSLFSNDDVAKRAFVDLLNSAGFNPHKEDYAIYLVSSFNPNVVDLGEDFSDLDNPVDHNFRPTLVFDGADSKKESVDE